MNNPLVPPSPVPHVGAFVLETLTLGMYGEPRHTLREYVQNSFDAIRAAQRTGFLSGRGKVDITVGPDSIVIFDNGLGVPAGQAWNTLTAIGASKKDRQRDAGFRGIGRLAGMAYCDELIFRTTFSGETIETTVTFDCTRLLKAMSPDEGGDVELAKLLASSIGFEQHEKANAADHFFEVTLRGTLDAPEILTDPARIREYLSETAPVVFNPAWARGAEIERAYATFFGAPPETVDLSVVVDGQTTPIFKPYSDRYEYAKGETELTDIEFVQGDADAYWGWIGRLAKSAAVTDRRTRGLRVRVRNIQVDGTEMFETLFADVKPSYGRFSAYYVGEIHIDPEWVIPNARRDSFEETQDWLKIKAQLTEKICRPLADEAYSASKRGQLNVDKVVEDIGVLVGRSHTLTESTRATYDQVVDLMNSARRLRQRASTALKVASDFDEAVVEEREDGARPRLPELQDATKNVEQVETQARMLIGRFLQEDERIVALKARLRQEIIQEVLDIVNAYVDPATYQKIRRRLQRPD